MQLSRPLNHAKSIPALVESREAGPRSGIPQGLPKLNAQAGFVEPSSMRDLEVASDKATK